MDRIIGNCGPGFGNGPKRPSRELVMDDCDMHVRDVIEELDIREIGVIRKFIDDRDGIDPFIEEPP